MRNGSDVAITSNSAQSIVRRFSQEIAIVPEDDLASSLAAKEAQDKQDERSRASLVYSWQELFQLEKNENER